MNQFQFITMLFRGKIKQQQKTRKNKQNYRLPCNSHTANSDVLIDFPSATHEISIFVEDVVRHVAIVVHRLAATLANVQGPRNWIATIYLSEKQQEKKKRI